MFELERVGEVFVLHMKAGDIDSFLAEVHRLFARILGFSMLTVAAVNGHAFAGGAMLAMAHDFKIMRSDRGYF